MKFHKENLSCVSSISQKESKKLTQLPILTCYCFTLISNNNSRLGNLIKKLK